jgi:hypothetical protein
MKVMFDYTEEDGFICHTDKRPFEGISGIADTQIGALKEWCIAMQGAIDVYLEDECQCE